MYQAEGAAGLLKAYALGFVEPFGTLWFIYMLAVFFVVAKAARPCRRSCLPGGRRARNGPHRNGLTW